MSTSTISEPVHNFNAGCCRMSSNPTRVDGYHCSICHPQSFATGAMSNMFERAKVEAPPEERLQSILEEAEGIINGDRADDYGSALESFTRIGKLWEPVLGIPVTAEQVCIALIELKVARAMHDIDEKRPIKRDTIVDIAGYAGCLEKIVKGRQQ